MHTKEEDHLKGHQDRATRILTWSLNLPCAYQSSSLEIALFISGYFNMYEG